MLNIFRIKIVSFLFLAVVFLVHCGTEDAVVAEDPAETTYAVGGTITGLSGTVVLRNGEEDLSVDENGSFTFLTKVADEDPYAVTVLTQPDTQTCMPSSASGIISGANIDNVTVVCSTNTYTVSGTITGLSGTVVLRNGEEDLSVDENGSFAFLTKVADGTTYDVTVQTQPSLQTCTVVSGGGGTMDGDNVTNVMVVCVSSLTNYEGTYAHSDHEDEGNNGLDCTDLFLDSTNIPMVSDGTDTIQDQEEGGNRVTFIPTSETACTGTVYASFSSTMVECTGCVISGATRGATGTTVTFTGCGGGNFLNCNDMNLVKQ
ncbi:MAG: hypothetical protein Q7S00_03395 [bacterium]|nr:hypothetical protein [bacterium]